MSLSSSITIQERKIGGGAPCFLISEVAQTHDGSIGLAHSFIDATADAGADAIKFQTHIASAESTEDEKFRIKFSYKDKTRYDYWKRMEFAEEEWKELYEHAKQRNIIFLSSPFSVEAVELLDRVGVAAWKIGSGEINNTPLFSAIAKTKKPVLLSTGMSNWEEITEAVGLVMDNGTQLAIFQCTSKYPVKLEEIGLNVLGELSDRFNIPSGLSDHSGSIYPSLAAMAMKADLIEVHVTFHHSMFGPDVPVSLTFEDLRLLALSRDAFHIMQTNPVDKNEMREHLSDIRSLFNKSVALKEDQPVGTVLEEDMLTTKKPGTGIPASKINDCIGKKLKRGLLASRLLSWNDIE